jgi:tRNA G18 (ribose-2'-O)-methylase SpoU
MTIIRINSPGDERLSEFRYVPDPELVARLGLFVAEGRLVVARLLSSALETRALLLTEAALAALEPELVRHELPVYIVPQALMNGVAGFNFHRGCLAIGVRPPLRNWRDIILNANRLVVLERVGNVDNIGSIFRSATAFDIDGVLLHPDCGDPLYRKAIRTSMAASLTMPFARVPWPDALREINGNGWATVALTPDAGAPTLREVAAGIRGRQVAIVLGHEGEGLTGEGMSACTHRARIPMAKGADSVNVGTAAAIAMYELGG